LVIVTVGTVIVFSVVVTVGTLIVLFSVPIVTVARFALTEGAEPPFRLTVGSEPGVVLRVIRPSESITATTTAASPIRASRKRMGILQNFDA